MCIVMCVHVHSYVCVIFSGSTKRKRTGSDTSHGVGKKILKGEYIEYIGQHLYCDMWCHYM